ncbi:hypothetical protein EDC01DRAFT_747020 [Geopyxis carbonaria]|nr:hypothetical protein EDC01DRAFT_747020 [Geopyxis carbonaria]
MLPEQDQLLLNIRPRTISLCRDTQAYDQAILFLHRHGPQAVIRQTKELYDSHRPTIAAMGGVPTVAEVYREAQTYQLSETDEAALKLAVEESIDVGIVLLPKHPLHRVLLNIRPNSVPSSTRTQRSLWEARIGHLSEAEEQRLKDEVATVQAVMQQTRELYRTHQTTIAAIGGVPTAREVDWEARIGHLSEAEEQRLKDEVATVQVELAAALASIRKARRDAKRHPAAPWLLYGRTAK